MACLTAPPLDKPPPPLGQLSPLELFQNLVDIGVCYYTPPQTINNLITEANFDSHRGKSTENKHNFDIPKRKQHHLLII
jgi:hypothetical protein